MDAQGGQFGSALQAASFDGNVKLVQKLLDNGADINVQGGAFTNALLAASMQGREKAVQLLLDRGASFSLRGSSHPTPVHPAMVGHKGVLQILLNSEEPGIKIKDNYGRSALFFAAVFGNHAFFQAMDMEKFNGEDQKDRYGSTPLSIAVRYGHIEVVKMLLAGGSVDCESSDRFGRSVSWWAQKNRDTSMQKLLSGYTEKRTLPIPIDELFEFDSRLWSRQLGCDVCNLGFSRSEVHYQCAFCNRGDFHMCMECYELGAWCLQDGHDRLCLMNSE